MSDGMQMTNCGSCQSCLAGAFVHGPYPHHFERTPGGGRVHKYGSGSVNVGGTGRGGALSYYDYAEDHEYGEEPLTEEEAIERQVKQAEQEEHERQREGRLRDRTVKRRVAAAEKRLGRPLTAREVALVAYAEKDAQRRQSQLTMKQRRKLEEILGMQARHKQLQRERSREIERRRAERGTGLTERAYRAIKKDVEKQVNAEIRGLQKQIRESKAELSEMLSAQKTPA